MKIKMTLLSDAIPGNGESVPGAEDISVLHDEQGFPYYKGGTLKGLFREELCNYLCWENADKDTAAKTCRKLLGASGDDREDGRKLRFSNLTLSAGVRQTISDITIDGKSLGKEEILDAFSYMRTFTAIDSNGMVKKGSLRNARCLKEGLIFYGEIACQPEDEELVKEILSLIRRIGTMRSRGFGSVRIEAM